MIVNVDNCAPIIERLLQALVDDKRSVELEANCLPGRVNWIFRVDVNDTGKIMGKEGSHIHALELILARMGKGVSEEWIPVANDPVGVDRHERNNAKVPETHSTKEDLALLKELIRALDISADINVSGNIPGGFTFKINAEGHRDQETLLEAHDITFKLFGTVRYEKLNLLGALGTLFRAIAKRQGVRYRIDAGA